MSKTHFYGRAAPEAILAVDLTALLPPRSGGKIFSDRRVAAERFLATLTLRGRRMRQKVTKAAEATNKRMDELHARKELN